jgi:CRISPR-associated endonuclease/helicase Cas3
VSLERCHFAEFFAEVHDTPDGPGVTPFAWQERLLDAVLEAGRWPDQVVAPTGAGKTAVIDVHVFAQALTAEREPGRRPPRRLALVVGRRALVDDQYEHAQAVSDRLASPRTEVMAEIADRLWLLRGHRHSGDVAGVSPLVLGRLRGGQPPSRYWRDHPAAAAVLCCTPDMWGSRVLFRGYGSSRWAWPRETGLLAFDSVAVVDEAHLSRQLLCTARRVSQLATVAERPLPVWPLQVVETTATPPATGDLTAVGVEPQDLADGGTLADRLARPKPVTLVEVKGWTGTRAAERRAVAAALADAVTRLRDAADEPHDGQTDGQTREPGTVGCFVNTVNRAVETARELRTRGLRTVLLCGQIRPYDLDRLRAEHPGVLQVAGCADVDAIVATQTLEVGADLDLAGIVTELAAGSSLAQRAGRVNRRGRRRSGPVTVLVPADPITDKTRSGPYRDTELRDALDWLQNLAKDSDGLAPWRLRTHTPPAGAARRRLYQRPELAQAWHWARSSDDLAADPDLGLWLAENLDTDASVGIVVRHTMPAAPSDAVRLVRAMPPQRHETFSVPIATASAALGEWRSGSGRTRAEASDPEPVTIVVRSGDVVVLDWREPHDQPGVLVPRLRPGDVVVLDEAIPLFTTPGAVGDQEGFSPQVVATTDGAGATVSRHPAPDVYDGRAALPNWARHEVGGVLLRIERGDFGDPRVFDALAGELAPPAGPDDDSEGETAQRQRRVLRDWLAGPGPAHGFGNMGRGAAMTAAAHRLLAQDPRRAELVLHHSTAEDEDTDAEAGGLVRIVIRDRRQAAADEELRQVFSPATNAITLDAHQAAVAGRAAQVGLQVGLGDELIGALRSAGAHHDDGKDDARFQRRLGSRGGVVLAKSRPGTAPEQARRNAERSGLPPAWRHEQLSVTASWDAVHAEPLSDPLLVARLVGTSHGRGRRGYPHTSAELLALGAPARLHDVAADLFDAGGWDELVELTHERYGVWGCAYLEALLRAADGQISEEGS